MVEDVAMMKGDPHSFEKRKAVEVPLCHSSRVRKKRMYRLVRPN
jgi:hypothetical protein